MTDARTLPPRKQNPAPSMSDEETKIEEVAENVEEDDDLPELEDAPGAEGAAGDDDVPADMAGSRKNQSRAEKKARKVRCDRAICSMA